MAFDQNSHSHPQRSIVFHQYTIGKLATLTPSTKTAPTDVDSIISSIRQAGEDARLGGYTIIAHVDTTLVGDYKTFVDKAKHLVLQGKDHLGYDRINVVLSGSLNKYSTLAYDIENGGLLIWFGSLMNEILTVFTLSWSILRPCLRCGR